MRFAVPHAARRRGEQQQGTVQGRVGGHRAKEASATTPHSSALAWLPRVPLSLPSSKDDDDNSDLLPDDNNDGGHRPPTVVTLDVARLASAREVRLGGDRAFGLLAPYRPWSSLESSGGDNNGAPATGGVEEGAATHPPTRPSWCATGAPSSSIMTAAMRTKEEETMRATMPKTIKRCIYLAATIVVAVIVMEMEKGTHKNVPRKMNGCCWERPIKQ